MRRILFAILLAATLPCCAAGARANTSVEPSFACEAATTRGETLICHDPDLAAADLLMARLYASVGVSAFGTGPSNETSAQGKWLAERDQACTDSDEAGQIRCVKALYDARNRELAIAGVFREPDLALDTLRKVSPREAPLIEAIYLFSRQPPGADWDSPALAASRDRLLDLLEPGKLGFTDDDKSYGKEILAGYGFASARDAIASDKAFGEFVQITSAYLRDAPVPPLMPCSAIVRHPELLDATGPAFGSTLDNFVLSPDCAQTLPPLPELDRLSKRLFDAWPECEGTIRFAAYRSFELAENAARLATDSNLAGERSTDVRTVKRKGVTSGQVDAAIAELAAYYRHYDRASPANALPLARAMLGRMMTAAHECM